MDTRKFDYLENIREIIETGDYDELDDYIEDIHDHVKNDPEFQELFAEIKSKNYGDVTSLIEEFIYQDIQSNADVFLNDESLMKLAEIDDSLDFITGEEVFEEEISFEEFNDDNYESGLSQEDDL